MPRNDEQQERTYRSTADRLTAFRREHPDWRIVPEQVPQSDPDKIAFRTGVFANGSLEPIATGYYALSMSEERLLGRTYAQSFATAQTRSAGRALAFLMGEAEEVCTAEELRDAVRRQEQFMPVWEAVVAQNRERIQALGLAELEEAIRIQEEFLSFMRTLLDARVEGGEAPGPPVSSPDPRAGDIMDDFPESLRNNPNLRYDRHGERLFIRGVNRAATEAVRGLLETSGFRPGWVRRVPADTAGIPAGLPEIRDVMYERHGNVVVTSGNTYRHTARFRNGNEWEFWWIGSMARREAA
jgi:hypothetical protein